MCKVYIDVGGIKSYTMFLPGFCPPVRKKIHSLKLRDYLHVHADNPWYNYILRNPPFIIKHVVLFTIPDLLASPERYNVSVCSKNFQSEMLRI